MQIPEIAFVLALAGMNLGAAVWGADRLGRMLALQHPGSTAMARLFTALLCVYFLECVAFAAGMATQVFVFPLAVLWGVLVGRWPPPASAEQRPRRTPLFLALYTSVPTLSFCALLLIASHLSGRHLVDPQSGLDFGIPAFLPKPFQTVLGFCLALGAITVAGKCAIITATAAWVLRIREHRQDASASC